MKHSPGLERRARLIATWIGIYTAAGPVAAFLVGAVHEGSDLDFPGWGIENKFIRIADLAYQGVWASARSATEWYVSPTGTGTDCSKSKPCSLHTATCARECTSFNPQPDDIIWVLPGTYTPSYPKGGENNTFMIEAHGLKGHPVTYRNYKNGKWVIDCNGDQSGTGGLGFCIGTSIDSSGAKPNGQYVTIWGAWIINSSKETRLYPNEKDPATMHDGISPIHVGDQVINCFVHDAVDGLLNRAGAAGASNKWVNGGAHIVRGNFFQYSGDISTTTRAQGHSMYIKNGDAAGEDGRSTFDGNVGLRAFNVGVQLYSTTDQVSYITLTNHVEAANGIPVTASWPALSCCANSLYAGTSGGVQTSCHPPGSKTLYLAEIEDNWFIGGSGLTIGGSKGSCNNVFRNNQFVFTGGQSATCNTTAKGCSDSSPCGWWPPVTVTNNTFYTTLNGGGCPAPALTLANYPTNTVKDGFPTTGKVFKYWKSPDETGRGWVAALNWDGSPTVTIDLDAMGGFAGEAYRVQAWQDMDPWDPSKDVATGTCPATCGTISVTTKAASVRAPGLTLDGSAPFPAPPDVGPTYVMYFLYPRWEAPASTPAPAKGQTR
jgi:hypothetical protein